MESTQDLLKQMFGDSLYKLKDELRGSYVSGMSNAMSLINNSLTMVLLHKTVFNENKESTIELMVNLLTGAHQSIATAVIESLKGSDELDLSGEDLDGLDTEIRKILDETFEDIKSGTITGFEGILSRVNNGKGPESGITS